MKRSSSHHTYFTTLLGKVKEYLDKQEDTTSRLYQVGFDNVPKSAVKAYKNIVDKQAFSLIGDNDAFYANRLLSWKLTDKLLKEVR